MNGYENQEQPMLKIKRYLIPLILLMSISCSAFAFDYDLSIIAGERINSINNFWDESQRNYRMDDVYNLLLVYPSIDIEITEELRAYFELNAAFYWDRETDEYASEERIELFEGFFEWNPSLIPGATLKAGKIEFISADGYILDKDSPGIFIKYNLAPGFNLPATLKFFWSEIEEESSIFHLQYDHRIAFLERIGVFWVNFHDRDNGVGDILNLIFPVEYHFESSGNWQYAGVELEKFLGRFLFKGTYIYQFGNIDLDIQRWPWREEVDLNISAHLFDLNLSVSIGEKMNINVFYLFATGDDLKPLRFYASQNLNAFFSVAPFIRKTSIFFNGGVDDTFTSDTIAMSGLLMAGLMVPGVTISYHPQDNIGLENTWALLMAQKERINRGDRYGWETDFIFNWYFAKNFSFFVEADYMHLENFFINPENDNLWKGIIGLNFYY